MPRKTRNHKRRRTKRRSRSHKRKTLKRKNKRTRRYRKRGGKSKNELARIAFDKAGANVTYELNRAIDDFNSKANPPFREMGRRFNDEGTTRLQQAVKQFPLQPLPDIKNWRGKVTKKEKGRQALIFHNKLTEIDDTLNQLGNAVFEEEKEQTLDPGLPRTSTQVGSPLLTDKILDFKDEIVKRLGQPNKLREQVNQFRNNQM